MADSDFKKLQDAEKLACYSNFGPPIKKPAHIRHDGPTHHDVVEMRDDEVSAAQVNVSSSERSISRSSRLVGVLGRQCDRPMRVSRKPLPNGPFHLRARLTLWPVLTLQEID